jgi:hypothetical protein
MEDDENIDQLVQNEGLEDTQMDVEQVWRIS